VLRDALNLMPHSDVLSDASQEIKPKRWKTAFRISDMRTPLFFSVFNCYPFYLFLIFHSSGDQGRCTWSWQSFEVLSTQATGDKQHVIGVLGCPALRKNGYGINDMVFSRDFVCFLICAAAT
jgi:hypothetical protein